MTVNTLKAQGRRADLFGEYFDRLNALHVMVALGRARKLKKKLGRAIFVQSEVMAGPVGGASSMRAVAIKKGQNKEKAAGFQEIGTVRCDGCGEEFVIWHESAFVNKWLADQQAHWLEKVLAEEHERDRKHPDRIELPD